MLNRQNKAQPCHKADENLCHISPNFYSFFFLFIISSHPTPIFPPLFLALSLFRLVLRDVTPSEARTAQPEMFSAALSNFSAGARWHCSLGPSLGQLDRGGGWWGVWSCWWGDKNTVLGGSRNFHHTPELTEAWASSPSLGVGSPPNNSPLASGLHRPGAGCLRIHSLS